MFKFKFKVTLINEQGEKRTIDFDESSKAMKDLKNCIEYCTWFGGKVQYETIKIPEE